MARIFVVGATSAIAAAYLQRSAGGGHAFHLVARDMQRLSTVASDLEVRGAAAVTVDSFDALVSEPAELVANAAEKLGGLDIVLLAHGSLGEQEHSISSAAQTRKELEINAMSTIELLTELSRVMERQGSGTIAVISSVAGDRGRQSNYVYGAAKGAVSIFLQGLRNRLTGRGVHVCTIKPGFVDTPMTESFPKGPLWASAEQVAQGIERAIERKRNVVYLPWFWRYIMWVIRVIPESIFKKFSL